MASFTTFEAKARAFIQATMLVNLIRGIYRNASTLRALMLAYQNQTDPDLVTAVNTAFTTTQRQELASVIQTVATLASDLETNHTSMLGT